MKQYCNLYSSIIDQHVTSMGQKRSPQQDLNLLPPKNQAGTLSTLSYGDLMKSEAIIKLY